MRLAVPSGLRSSRASPAFPLRGSGQPPRARNEASHPETGRYRQQRGAVSRSADSTEKSPGGRDTACLRRHFECKRDVSTTTGRWWHNTAMFSRYYGLFGAVLLLSLCVSGTLSAQWSADWDWMTEHFPKALDDFSRLIRATMLTSPTALTATCGYQYRSLYPHSSSSRFCSPRVLALIIRPL